MPPPRPPLAIPFSLPPTTTQHYLPLPLTPILLSPHRSHPHPSHSKYSPLTHSPLSPLRHEKATSLPPVHMTKNVQCMPLHPSRVVSSNSPNSPNPIPPNVQKQKLEEKPQSNVKRLE